MNKQELIEKYENKLKDIQLKFGANFKTKVYEGLVEDLRQLDELKVTIPQFVADWYEENKDSFDYNLWEYLVDWEEQEPSDFKNWINNRNNAFQTLVNMHQFGYEVEKERRYTVKMRTTNQPLFYNSLEKKLFFSLGELATQFTFEQLEEAGFGEVFNSPLFEVEEVEDE